MQTTIDITLPDGNTITKTATGVMTNLFFRYILKSHPRPGALGPHNVSIVFSSIQVDENESTQELANIVTSATMSPVSDSGSRWISDTEPPYILLRGVIPEPDNVDARIFGTVGICLNIRPGNYTNEKRDVFAYTKLDPPIEQLAGQFIPIDYRIYFEDRQWFNFINSKEARNEFAENLLKGRYNWNNYTSLYCCFQKPNWSDYKAFLPVRQLRFASWTDAGVNWSNPYNLTSNDYIYNYSLYKYKQGIDRDEYWFVGRIFSFLLLGSNLSENAAFSYDFFKNPNEPFQTSFWHASTSNQPFFNPQTIGSSSGTITIDHLSETDKWNKNYPDLYKIEITKNGAVGTSEYKFSRRRHFGFYDNSYEDRWSHIPWLNWMRQPHPDFYGWQNWADIIYISETKVLRYDPNGITIVDLFTGEFKSWFMPEQLSEDDPKIFLLNIFQVDVNSNQQYFSVASKASVVTFGVNNEDGLVETAEKVYGVSYGLDDTLYILATGLNQTSHGGISLKKKNVDGSLENVQLQNTSNLPSELNFDFTKFIKANKVKDELVFVVQHETNANIFHIVWCDPVTGLISYGGTSSELSAHPGCIETNPLGDWFISTYKLSFASSNHTRTSTTHAPSLNTDDDSCPYGSGSHYKIAFYENDLIKTNELIDSESNHQTLTTYNGLIGESLYIHIGRGVVVSSKGYIRQLFSSPSNNDYFWESYGWNGSTWIKEFNGSKVTHENPELLIDNLSIKFEGSEVGSFVEKEHLTQTVCWGLLKDNVTTQFQYNIEWWSRNVTEEFYSGNIPPQNELNLKDILTPEKKSEFISIEWDMLHKWEVKINNISVTLESIHVNSVPVPVPSPGEIGIVKVPISPEIDSYDNNEVYYSDTIRFNPDDSGKAFTITYYWVGR